MTEICVHCGKNVVFGSGNFVNRIPFYDKFEDRIEAGVNFPEGEYSCAECEAKYDIEHPHYECKDCGDINYIESGLVNGKCGNCGSTNWINIDSDAEKDVMCGKILESLFIKKE